MATLLEILAVAREPAESFVEAMHSNWSDGDIGWFAKFMESPEVRKFPLLFHSYSTLRVSSGSAALA